MLLIVFGFIKSLINPLASIAGKIADAKVELARAETDKERIHAKERVDTLEQRRAVMVAESAGSFGWINAAIRAAFALPFVVYNGKLVLWDKVLGLGSTDGLSAELFQIEMACIGFYFLYDITARLKR
jgi:hypothetical protein